ncbi:hypothetical protein ALC57_11692 [Trachymyrmex cornetzi]|uniref:Uncharacterized protein n=1 Tax=Trachymyrmex cornetzi TaxID=471704 RepID=A0A151J250_9HYME|nr:hypothetical protein ALC57_11692 [Trachymyrmex cornetzi]
MAYTSNLYTTHCIGAPSVASNPHFILVHLVCLDHFRNMGSSIVMLQNHFIVSLVVLRSFVFQCSAQTHQLHSIPIACDCFSRF